MAINGNNILVYRNGTAIAGTTSNEIQTNVETLEIGAPNSSQWRELITQRKSWSVLVNYLISDFADVRDVLNVGATYTLKIRGRNSQDSTGVSGTAILKVCKITSTRGNLVSGSFQFEGTGQLS